MSWYKPTINTWKAIGGGLIAALLALGGALSIGSLSGYEAKELLENSLNNIYMICNTVVLASSTILALLLTLLGLTSSSKAKWKNEFFDRIKKIALFSTISLILGMVIFVVMNIPIFESEKVPRAWYSGIYYSTVIASSVLGGMMVAVVLMLYSTIIDIVSILGEGNEKDHPLVEVEDDEGEESKEEKE